MERVLAHYSVPPRSIGIFCDAGFAGKLAIAPEKDRIEREIARLYDLVFRLEEAGTLAYLMVAAHHDAGAENHQWPEQLATVSPLGSRVQAATYRALLGQTRELPNEYSMVLMLESGVGEETFRGLLTGDAGGATLTQALTATPDATATRFDFAKVAHHGSWNSHRGSPVPQRIRVPGESVAVVSSSSTSKKLPRREVLNDYLNAGWRVYDTGRREHDWPDEAPIGTLLSHATFWPDATEPKHDVVVIWSPESGLAATPLAARVMAEHTPFYPTARSSPAF